jgi:hypothetical protein
VALAITTGVAAVLAGLGVNPISVTTDALS